MTTSAALCPPKPKALTSPAVAVLPLTVPVMRDDGIGMLPEPVGVGQLRASWDGRRQAFTRRRFATPDGISR